MIEIKNSKKRKSPDSQVSAAIANWIAALAILRVRLRLVWDAGEEVFGLSGI